VNAGEDDHVRERFRSYSDHELFVAMGVLADWRDHAATEQEAERWSELFCTAGEVRDQRAAEVREFLDLVTPVAELLDDDDDGIVGFPV
jgi:hypothetical protein